MKHLHSTIPSLARLCAAALIAALPAAAMAGMSEITAAAAADKAAPMTDRLIVKYKDATVSAKGGATVPAVGPARMAILARAGQEFGLTMRTLHTTATGAHIVHLGKKMAVAEVAKVARELAARDPSVEYAEPDRMMHKLFTPNDPRYPEQWQYFDSVGGLRANTAWDLTTGSGVVVAVIDTGYRPHADLAGQIVQGYDFITDSAIAADGNGRDSDASDPGDSVTAGQCGAGEPASTSSWHGTHVAGTIAAKTGNALGVAGTAFNARVLPARVLGKCGGYTSDIADAIIWSSGGSVSGVPVNANPARVINMSLGGAGACDTTTQNAINSARSRGTVVVVAAGNEAQDASNSNPANCSGVVAVAATTKTGGRAYYSNFGAVVDVAAPGGDTRTAGGGILSTLNAGATTPGADNYAFYQGTSMATPHVAGVAALMLSRTPGMSPDAVEARLKQTARVFPASCVGCGSGIVDAFAAVNNVIVETNLEMESNNTTATANAVTANGITMVGWMGSTTDTDYFVVQLPPGKTLSSVLTPGSTSDYDLKVYNNAGTQIGSSSNGTGAIDSVSVTNTGSTTVARYVRVVYYSGVSGQNARYTLKLSW
jgi:serine protease